MDTFINYIIEAGLGLGIFTIVYWFVLRGETKFKATRLYLLFALLFSTLLPFLTVRIGSTENVLRSLRPATKQLSETNLLETVTVYASGLPAKVGHAILSFDYSVLVYQLGALAALFVIASGIFQLILMISKNRIYKMKGSRLVVSDKEQAPYSFFNYIFIGKSLTEQKNWKTIVHHEIEHVKQGHSFDVLFVDFMMIFQWFNPFYWMIRRMVRENHEFLADTGVLKMGLISQGRYKELLLSQAIGGRPVITSNFLNVRTIKKRFKMITKNNSKKNGFVKYTVSVITALMFTIMFACEDVGKIVQPESEVVFVCDGEIVDQSLMNSFDACISIRELDYLDIAAIYPELKDELKGKNITVLFDAKDKKQMEKWGLLQLDQQLKDGGNVDELLVESYGNEKSAPLDEEVFVIVEEMPEFPGGELALRKHIAESITYPAQAVKDGIEGKVYITFVVGSDGYVKNTKVARGVNSDLDAEAKRVVGDLPKWIPGMQGGKPVAVSYTVPINFQLK